MNLKRWFAWLCLALMLVAELFLYRAIREKDAMQLAMNEAQHESWAMRKDLDELKNSNAGQQAAEIRRLQKQNEIYTNRLAKAQAMIDRLQSEFVQTTQNLATARTALQLQQQHLEQLQTENKLVTDAGITIIRRNACINNLRMIDGAKQQWALEHNQKLDAVPAPEDLLPYLKDGVFPRCPSGGKYAINSVSEIPTCTIADHVLPP